MTYVRLQGAVIACRSLEELPDGSLLADGTHLISPGCALSRSDSILGAIDKLVIVGTDLSGRRLEPTTRDPSLLPSLLSDRASGKYNLPYEIYGAVWHRDRHGFPALIPVCEFPDDTPEPKMAR